VSGYRHRDFDLKLEKMGRGELKAEGSDYDWSSRDISRNVSRAASPPAVGRTFKEKEKDSPGGRMAANLNK
jgi:hypothetical protein